MTANPPDAILFRCKHCGRTQLEQLAAFDPTRMNALVRVRKAFLALQNGKEEYGPRACHHRTGSYSDGTPRYEAGPLFWLQEHYEIVPCERNVLTLLQR